MSSDRCCPRFVRSVLLMSLSACFSSIALPLAQEEDRPEPVTEYVVVTANRVETPLSQVGSTVTVITAADLARKQYWLLVDALREVPGLDVRRTGGPGSTTSIFIRGTDSDHTLVLLDGVEMNDPSSPSRLPFLSHLTTNSVERIEISRGPQSTLYGGDAIGGIINIITKRGQGDPTVGFSANRGSFSTHGESASVWAGDEKFSYFFSASYLESDSFSAQSSGTEDDPYRNTTASGRFRWNFSEDLSLDVLARHTDAQIHFDGFSSEEGNRIDAAQTVVKVEPSLRSFDEKWFQRIGLQAVLHERDTTSAFPSLVKGKLFAVDWENDLSLDEHHTLTLGLVNEWEEAEFPTFDDHANTFAFYAQDKIDLGERFFATVGLRTDDHSKFGTETTYRLTGGYRTQGSGTTIRGSYGTGFKAPSLSQLNEMAFGGNPDLDAEISRGFDLGISQTLAGERLLVGATYFRNNIDDLIIAVFDPGLGLFRNFNVDEAKTQGLEVLFNVKPTSALTIGANYTYTDTEAKGSPAGFGLSEGSRLLRRPRHKASLDIHLAFPNDRASLTLSGLYVGERADIDPVTFSITPADHYLVFNLAASYTTSTSVELFARIENLLDEEYEEVLGFGTAEFSTYGGVRLTF